jgi:DNA-binding Lrp family transcriptional regulator
MKLDNEDLATLYALFQKFKVLSAKAISEKTKTYPATAKRRVTSLRKMGVRLKTVRVREGERGPLSVAWELEP